MYSQVINTIEAAITQLGLEPAQAKAGEGQYNLSKDGHTEVMLDAWDSQERVFFQALSPVVPINDITRSEVLKMLLEENHGLVEAAFALVNNSIVLKHTIECNDNFSPAIVLAALVRIGHYSQLYREKWQALTQTV